MNKGELVFTEQAMQSFRDFIRLTQQVSLVSAEKVRQEILHKLHYIRHHPEQGTKKIELGQVGMDVREAEVLNYHIYFKVEDETVIVLDILLDKEKSEK